MAFKLKKKASNNVSRIKTRPVYPLKDGKDPVNFVGSDPIGSEDNLDLFLNYRFDKIKGFFKNI